MNPSETDHGTGQHAGKPQYYSLKPHLHILQKYRLSSFQIEKKGETYYYEVTVMNNRFFDDGRSGAVPSEYIAADGEIDVDGLLQHIAIEHPSLRLLG